MRQVIFIIIISSSFTTIAQTYDRQAATDYANYWWDGRNTMNGEKSQTSYNTTWGTPYYNYNGLGGDCANFVSQCLIAGGLDLTLGANGNGLGVDDNDCITGVYELVTHLKNYQRTLYYYTTNAANEADVYSETDLGDPVFLGGHNDNYAHSIFCSAINGDKNLYNSHSADYYQEYYTNWNYVYAHYFHIKGPEHCYNCELDGDETAIDCGGSCPPCEVAPDNKNYDYNTSSLPAVTRAINYIMAGNAQVQVLSGQNVHFISLGHIILKPGFHAQSGSTFHAERKHMREQATADCPKFCDPIEYNAFVHPDPVEWEIVGGRYFEIYVWQSCNGTMNNIYYGNGIIRQEGLVELWDGYTGVNYNSFCVTNQFTIEVYVTSCQGNVYNYVEVIAYFDPQPIINDSTNTDVIEFYQKDNSKENIYVSLIPNPNEGVFTIKSSFDFTEINQLQIVDVLGREVYSIQTLNSNTIELPMGLKGTFFVKITIKDKVINKRIVVL